MSVLEVAANAPPTLRTSTAVTTSASAALCVGQNYTDHVAEMGSDAKQL
jgi:2-keto-4-pentenoate hydratase/2-oxohepta-3-ene-1,7-dioic acid hydratase in catechol pathway